MNHEPKYRYKVRKSLQTIEKIEITRETGMSVFRAVRGGESREAKVNELHRYFKTYDEAAAFLVGSAKAELARAEANYENAVRLFEVVP